MLTAEHLGRAEQQGIINAAQRQALVDLARANGVAPDDEPFKLVGGGNDVFVTIGIMILFSGLSFALFALSIDPSPFVQCTALAAIAWLVAEFVTRLYRMRLASTILGIIFVGCILVLLGSWAEQQLKLDEIDTPLKVFGLRNQISTIALACMGGIIAASLLYFWRFRVPIMSAIIALAVTALAFAFIGLFTYDRVVSGQAQLPRLTELPQVIADALYVPLICGLIIFAVAVAMDLHDRARRTIWSDCAFWLHVVCAPLLVHPLFILATGQDVVFGRIEPDFTATIVLATLIGSFVLIALAIDRRSLLIPVLVYFGTLGIYNMVSSAAAAAGIPPIAFVLLVVGTLIIMFGAGWQRIRKTIIAPLLPAPVIRRLPPIKI